jgi:hypothetical protein
MRLVLSLALLFAGAQAALTAPDPCAKFSDADAYNNCLASFGPPAGDYKTTRPPPEEKPALNEQQGRSFGKSPGRKAARHTPTKTSTHGRLTEGPLSRGPVAHGRTRMEIMVPSAE